MTLKQNWIQRTIDENESELLKLGNHPVASGWQGSKPEEYFAEAEIGGTTIFRLWRDEDREYHFLPGLGFKFKIGRRIISPFSEFREGNIFFSSSRMRSGTENEKTRLWLDLPDYYDFFSILNAIRAKDRFAPFHVRGDEELVDNVKSPDFLTIAAYVEHDEIRAKVKNILATDIETIIQSFIKICIEEVEKFRALKPHYRETDADGTRLWTDQGLQSKEYYELKKKLGRELLGKFGRVLNRHEIKYQTSWSITAALSMMRHAAGEYGWPTVIMWGATILAHKIRNAFRSYEELRQERLNEYKNECKNRHREQ